MHGAIAQAKEEKEKSRSIVKEEKDKLRSIAKEETEKSRSISKVEKDRKRLAHIEHREIVRENARRQHEQRRLKEKACVHMRKVVAYLDRQLVRVALRVGPQTVEPNTSEHSLPDTTSSSSQPQQRTFCVRLQLSHNPDPFVHGPCALGTGMQRLLLEYKPYAEPRPPYSSQHEWVLLLNQIELGLQCHLGEGDLQPFSSSA